MQLAFLYIGLSQSFFAAFIIATKKHRFLADRILLVWLLFIAFEMALSLVIESSLAFPETPIMNISLLFPLTYMPFMYIYVKSLIADHPEFNKKDFFHFIPVLVFFMFLLLFLTNNPIFTSSKLKLVAQIYRHLYGIYFIISFILYSFVLMKRINEHQDELKDKFSYQSHNINLNWIKFILAILIVTISGFLYIGLFYDIDEYLFDPRLFLRIELTVFAFSVSYFGINQPVFYKSGVEEPDTEKAKSNGKKYKSSNLTTSQAEKYIENLQHYMDNDKPYLNPELTIMDVANQIKISRHYLTQVININLKKNFYQFINEYRVQEMKTRLTSPDFNHITIVSIAYECGFNSKSTANAIFKKMTGKTPSEYRNV